MPIEIKELHIRVNVNPPAENAQQSARAPGSARNGAASPTGVQQAGAQQASALIAECVEQVMDVIERKKER